jgi:hypothetical protein
MENKKNIVWIASYPKSGNTWFRALLTNYLNKSEEPVNINALLGNIASNRMVFDEATGIDSSSLTKQEILHLRPEVYKYLSDKNKNTVYQKIHDAFIYVDKKRLLVPPEHSKGIIYLIRNPLEISVSFAAHLNKSIDKTIDIMADKDYAFCDKTHQSYTQLEQPISSWNQHVISWTEQEKIPVLIIRYEDLFYNTNKELYKILNFLGIEIIEDEVTLAIEKSSFNILKNQELKQGFIEKSPVTKRFFRKGNTNSWEKALYNVQFEKIIDNHSAVMKKFGYLNN